MNLYVQLSFPGPNWIPGKPIYEQNLMEHAKYQERLLEQGKLVLAGPFSDSSGGLTVLKVETENEARAIMEKDPAVIDGVFKAHVRPWHVVFQSED